MYKHVNILFALLAMVVTACHSVPEWPEDARGNLDALWTIIDEHYCFFEENGVDWDSVHTAYSARITPKTSYTDLYVLCSGMLDELRDGHVNLVAPFAVSYYKKWWSDYPQNYDERLVQQYYLHFGGLSRGAITYAQLPDSVGYMRIPTLASGLSHSVLDWAFALLHECRGLIIDVRDNGGGQISAVETLVSHLIDQRMLAGYISHKAGPGHGDFSEPYAYYFDPVDPAVHVRWQRPVVVLQNRSTFSAANNLVSVLRHLPGVTLVGDTSGGGSGMPFGSEIPVGWSVRFSASPVYDSHMQSTEQGCKPHIHVDLDPLMALDGIDTMLETAINLVKQYPVPSAAQ